MLVLDHIAVAAETLDAGADWVETALGVKLSPGGEHPLMGTHNRLLGLADGLYLEVIAINPDAAVPRHPRWFDLDRFKGGPRLTNWICRTDDLAGTLAGLPVDAGQPVALSRGDLKWQMAVPADGILPYDQTFPALIEWEGAAHPAKLLPDSGCRLTHLTISHPDADQLRKTLAPLLGDRRISYVTGAVGFETVFDTPNGQRMLR